MKKAYFFFCTKSSNSGVHLVANVKSDKPHSVLGSRTWMEKKRNERPGRDHWRSHPASYLIFKYPHTIHKIVSLSQNTFHVLRFRPWSGTIFPLLWASWECPCLCLCSVAWPDPSLWGVFPQVCDTHHFLFKYNWLLPSSTWQFSLFSANQFLSAFKLNLSISEFLESPRVLWEEGWPHIVTAVFLALLWRFPVFIGWHRHKQQTQLVLN